MQAHRQPRVCAAGAAEAPGAAGRAGGEGAGPQAISNIRMQRVESCLKSGMKSCLKRSDSLPPHRRPGACLKFQGRRHQQVERRARGGRRWVSWRGRTRRWRRTWPRWRRTRGSWPRRWPRCASAGRAPLPRTCASPASWPRCARRCRCAAGRLLSATGFRSVGSCCYRWLLPRCCAP